MKYLRIISIFFSILFYCITAQAQVIRVAVIGFEKYGGISLDFELGLALQQGIIDSLAPYQKYGITVIDRGNLEHIIQENNLQKAGLITERDSNQYKGLAHCDIIIGGNYQVTEENIKVLIRVENIKNENIVISEIIKTCTENTLFDIFEPATNEIIKLIGLSQKKEKPIIDNTMNAKSFMLYLKGKESLLCGPNYESRMTKTLQYYKQALELSPDEPLYKASYVEVNCLLSEYKRIIGKNKEAFQHLVEAIKNAKDLFYRYPWIPQCTSAWAMSLDSLTPYYFSVLEYSKKYNINWIKQYQSVYEFRKNEIIPLFEDALKNNPYSYSLLIMMSKALMENQKYIDAEELLKRAIDIEPLSFYSRTMLARCYIMQNRNRMAIHVIKNSEEYIGSDILSLWYITNAYINIDEYEKSIGYANKMMNLEPFNHLGYYTKGLVCLKLGKSDEAAQYFKQALVYYQLHGPSLLQMGKYYYNQSNKKESLKYYNTIINQLDSDKEFYEDEILAIAFDAIINSGDVTSIKTLKDKLNFLIKTGNNEFYVYYKNLAEKKLEELK